MTRRFAILTLALFVSLTATAPVHAGELEDNLAAVKSRIAALEQEIQKSSSQRSDLATEVLAARDRLETAAEAVVDAQAGVDQLTVELAQREDVLAGVREELAARFVELARTRAVRDEARDEAQSWVVQAYMRGGADEPSIAFSAAEIAEISVGVGYLDALTGNSSASADRYAEVVVREEMEEARVRQLEGAVVAEVNALDETKHEAELLASELAMKRAALDDEYEAQSALLARVDAAIAEFEGELASFEREEASIRETIAAAAAAAKAKADAEARAKAAAAGGSGTIAWPIRGHIDSPFGWRIHPITYTRRLHTGIDIDGPYGMPIKAADSGTVILAGVKGGFGNSVMIDHGNSMVTLYAHQQAINVSVGQYVDRGATIGWVGSTGDSTGPHLHFEVRINGWPVDPMRYL